jgi:hypothetical protein
MSLPGATGNPVNPGHLLTMVTRFPHPRKCLSVVIARLACLAEAKLGFAKAGPGNPVTPVGPISQGGVHWMPACAGMTRKD